MGNHIFLAFYIAVSLFTLVTFIAVLLSKMNAKMKVIWIFAVLFLGFLRFSINLDTGDVLVGILYLGTVVSFFRENTSYFLSFSIPAASIAYWAVRKQLNLKGEADRKGKKVTAKEKK